MYYSTTLISTDRQTYPCVCLSSSCLPRSTTKSIATEGRYERTTTQTIVDGRTDQRMNWFFFLFFFFFVEEIQISTNNTTDSTLVLERTAKKERKAYLSFHHLSSVYQGHFYYFFCCHFCDRERISRNKAPTKISKRANKKRKMCVSFVFPLSLSINQPTNQPVV